MTRPQLWPLALALCLGCAGALRAEYMQPDLEEVPVARLLENVSARLEQDAKQVELWRIKARLHGMAYARKSTQIQLDRRRKGEPLGRIWFGYEPAFVPFRHVRQAQDEDAAKQAKVQLELAVAAYRKALELEPKHLLTRLGLAWCRDQLGEKDAARKVYREVLAAAWEQDLKAVRYHEWRLDPSKPEPEPGHFGMGPILTVEVAGYLRPLLDPKEDAAELETIRTRVARINEVPRPITPIAIPLEAGLSPAECVGGVARFDLDGSGLVARWRWISPRAAWLVHDPRGAGRITSALQLFGGRSFNLFCRDGYAALALLDDDRDGWLRGDELAGLALWHDRNGDGVSQAGEVRPLTDHGIRGLSCRGQAHASGIPWSPAGVELASGERRPSYDLVLERR